MAYTVDGGKFAMAKTKSGLGFKELNTQSNALNQIEDNFGITNYLLNAKTYISNAITMAKTISDKENATLGRLLVLDKTFCSEYFSYLNGEESKMNNFVGPISPDSQQYLEYSINIRNTIIGIYNMYKEENSRGMLPKEGKEWLNYYEMVVEGYNMEDYLLSLDFENSLYKKNSQRYYNILRAQIFLRPDLTKSQKKTMLNEIDCEKAKKLEQIAYIKEDLRLKKEITKYVKHDTFSDYLSNGIYNNSNMALYQGLIADYCSNKRNYNKNILGYSDDFQEQVDLKKQIEAATHFKNAAEMRSGTIFDFGGKAKAEEIRGKQALGLATPEEIEYANASEVERFWSDAKTVAFSWVEGGAKFFENIMDGGLSLFSGAGQFVGADTSGLDFFIKTDLSELGYQNLAMNTGVLDRNSSLHYRHVGYSETVTNAAAVVAVSCFAPEAAAPLILGGIGFAHGAGSSYEQALNSGKTGREALLYAYGNGAIEAAGDALCAKTFSSDIIKTQGLKSYVAKSLVPRATYTVAAPVASEGLSVVFDGDFDYKSVIKNEVKSVATFAISEYINAKKAYNSKEAKINRIYNGDTKDISEEDLKKLLEDEDFLKFALDDNIDFNDPEKVYEKTNELYGKKYKDFIDDVKSDNIKHSAARKEWKNLSTEEKIIYNKLYNRYIENPKTFVNNPSAQETFNKVADIIENKNITFKTIKDNVLKTYRASKDNDGFLYKFLKKVKTPALSLPRDSALEILMDTDE